MADLPEAHLRFYKPACVESQAVLEEVLLTLILEVKAILNSKPLGYLSADIADFDPITPSNLLFGLPDGSFPQAVYPRG